LFEMHADDDLDVCGGNSLVVLEMSRVRRESSGVISDYSSRNYYY
jgi:hypothetical protein